MGYYAGMRKGEILPLTWNKVNFKDRVIELEAADTKDNEPRAVPICDELLKVLKGIPRGNPYRICISLQGQAYEGYQKRYKKGL